MFFKKSKKVEPVEVIFTHKELKIVLTFTNCESSPLMLAVKDPALFEDVQNTLSDNIGKNYIYKCGNGAVNLKHFCMVTFTEKDVAD